MLIEKTLKTKDGSYRFSGEITEQEHDFILSVGLNELLQNGALPFITLMDENQAPQYPSDPPKMEQ
jgi:hypothetical protein